MIDAALDTIATMAGLPRPVLALGAGTLAGLGFIPRIRFLAPGSWDPKSREVATQALTFALSFVVTYFAWGSGTDALLGALIVGLWTPALWNILLVVLGWWKPELRDALRKDVRVTDER